MRTGIKPMYTGVQNILNAFDSLRYNVPYFSIWCGRDMLFQCNTDDLDQGRQALVDILNAAEQSDNTDVLLIKFHPALKKGYVTNASEVVGTLPVRVVELQDGLSTITGLHPETGNALSTPGYYFVKQASEALGAIKDSNVRIEERLLALEAGNDKEVDVFDKIGSILEKPGMADLLGQIISRFMPVQPQPNIVMSGVPNAVPVKETPVANKLTDQSKNTVFGEAPVTDMVTDQSEEDFTPEENDIINNCINRLSAHCDVVYSFGLLADYADANPEMFKIVLNNLKV
jgi:hypothetical protein